MFTSKIRLTRSIILMLVIAAISAGSALAAQVSGPSSSQSPYLLPAMPNVSFASILTVGDSVNNKPDGSPYRMVGIPDGLGAFDNGDGTFTLLMNHELGATNGITRAHGAAGAFVSKWIIDKNTLQVMHGQDLIQNIGVWTANGWEYRNNVAISRLCSADLPLISAFYNAETGKGFDGRLFMNGEESGAEGLAYAHALDGMSWQLPWLGRFSWENSLAHPQAGDKTVVVGTDDSGSGQIYVYVGEKQADGNPVEKAGLTNGVLFGIKVDGFAFEDPASGIPSGATFSAYDFGNVAYTTGADLQTMSRNMGVTEFQRPEDGAWDPNNLNDFYFVTTASFTGNSRLWRLRFADPTNPTMGGTIDMLIDGSERIGGKIWPRMMDNLTINHNGEILIQEDPGGQDHVAMIWIYNIAKDQIGPLAMHDRNRFAPGASNFLTRDEESSGIIDVSDILGEGWYLLDVQAHYNLEDPELVQGGQLLAMFIMPKNPR
jgi:hypothetical protein